MVELGENGGFRPVWWPRSIERQAGPRFDRNYLQLNSIAAGGRSRDSFFSASAESPLSRDGPATRDFPVDGRGVVFSGRTRGSRSPRGLTRPHSARLLRGAVAGWTTAATASSAAVDRRRLRAIARLPGWTRGLCVDGRLAFVGTSRVIPRFRRYAPGLDPARCEAGVHAVDLRTGRVLGSLLWPKATRSSPSSWRGASAPSGSRSPRGGAARRVERFFFLGI